MVEARCIDFKGTSELSYKDSLEFEAISTGRQRRSWSKLQRENRSCG